MLLIFHVSGGLAGTVAEFLGAASGRPFRIPRHISALGEVQAQQTVGVLADGVLSQGARGAK